MASFRWDVRPENAFTALAQSYFRYLYREVLLIAKRLAPKIEAWMKERKVWIDRTGNARQGLYTEVVEELSKIGILMDHGVDYGKYLEFSNAGYYAIIGPALDFWSWRFFEEVRAIFS